jgi:hypothetical protein
VPEDHWSPWSRPEPASPHLGWASTASYPPAPVASYPATPTPVLPQGGYPVPPVQVHLTTPAGPGRGLAVAAVVLAGLALLVALLALAVGGVAALAGDSSGGYGQLRGTITPAKGGALTGSALAKEVATKVSEDGGEPEGITCPATAKVAQDVTTVCHGSDYGENSTFVVFFEDGKGAYTLLEI